MTTYRLHDRRDQPAALQGLAHHLRRQKETCAGARQESGQNGCSASAAATTAGN